MDTKVDNWDAAAAVIARLVVEQALEDEANASSERQLALRAAHAARHPAAHAAEDSKEDQTCT